MPAIRLIVALSLVSVVTYASAAQPNPKLVATIKASVPSAQKVKGNEQLFAKLVLPMAPLDLNILTALSPEAASREKNLFYGVMGAAAGLQRSNVLGLVHTFFAQNQPPQVLAREGPLEPKIEALVQQFKENKSIDALASWEKESYRVNDVFISNTDAVVYECHASYLPCARRKSSSVIKLNSDTLQLLHGAKPMVSTMRKLGLVALIKGKHGVRAVIDGIADNESGFFFANTDEVPKAFVGGKQIEFKMAVAQNIYFYLAN